MATPTGARHRDLEQRFKDLEDQVRTLAGATLRRRQLGVAEGDFVVQGGGSVIVRDGGGLRADYDDAGTSAYFGPLYGGAGSGEKIGDGLWAGSSTAGSSGSHHMFSAMEADDGSRVVMAGQTELPLNNLYVYTYEAIIYGADHTSWFYLPSNGDAQVACAPGRNIFLQNHSTTAAGANCVIGTNGAIQRSTSSLRYKTDVQLPHIDVQAVLALQPKRYRTKAEVAEHGEDAPTYVGFVAEDAAELDLHEWVTRDEDGRVDAFNYAQWGVAQQAVLQNHEARIKGLEDTVQAQADTIAALTARLDAAGI